MFTGFVSFCLVSSALIQSAEAAHQIPLIEVEVGKNVTLQCPVTEKEGKFVHWFKQSPGYMIQTVATGSYTKQTLSEEFNNGRFTVSEGQTLYFLSLKNVQKEDEATYFCQYGSAYSQTFNTSVYLAVNGKLCDMFIFFLPHLVITNVLRKPGIIFLNILIPLSLLFTKQPRSQ